LSAVKIVLQIIEKVFQIPIKSIFLRRIKIEFMATYKKRGYKPKKEKFNEEEINVENSTTAEVFDKLDETASKTEEFVAANQKYIFIVIGLVALAVLGYLGVDKFIMEPKAEEASGEMFHARKYFDEAVTATDNDSLFTLALNGADGKYGMLDIASKFSGTPAGNQANYYAGMAYLNMKDYQKAVEFLSNFSSDDAVLGPVAKGAIGDAFVQLNQTDDALGYYEEAANMTTNEYTTPMYLFKAATIALKLGNTTKALGYFNRIKTEFPKATEATNIDAFIGKAQAASN
jgi:tetratricopeptide (TPR) repeat protein